MTGDELDILSLVPITCHCFQAVTGYKHLVPVRRKSWRSSNRRIDGLTPFGYRKSDTHWRCAMIELPSKNNIDARGHKSC